MEPRLETAPDRILIGRAVVAGTLAALAGAALMTVLGGLFALSAGLLVVAFFIGRFTALAVGAAAGAGSPPRVRIVIAIALGSGGVVLAQVGLWLFALGQGGRLDLLAFLAETYGVLVPAEVALAAVGAWWPSRR